MNYTKKEEAIIISMMIHTALTCVPAKVKTPKVSKFQRSIIKGLRKASNSVGVERYNELAHIHLKAWNEAKERLSKDYMVSMAEMINSLESLLMGNEYRFYIYTEKAFNSAYNSFVGASSYEYVKETEDDARELTEMFSDVIGIKRVTTLSRLKYINEQNLILEGKIA